MPSTIFKKTGKSTHVVVSARKVAKGEVKRKAVAEGRFTEADRVRKVLTGVYGAEPIPRRLLVSRGL